MNAVDRLGRAGILERRVPLGPLTTYKAGGPAAFLLTISDTDQLEMVATAGLPAEHATLILGRGSNLVVADAGFPGVVIRLGPGFSRVSLSGDLAEAGAASTLPMLARSTVEAGLIGLEFFVGVPGSVGGAVHQNAGCFGSETADVLVEADIVDLSTGERLRAGPADLDLSYRHSNLSDTQLVTRARFRVRPGDTARARVELRRITRWRKENQPGGTFNAGSVFKNPPQVTAGELIDSLGLKGTRVGGVSVSERHANFFVAESGARSADILALVEEVRRRVLEETGIALEPEIQFVGFE